MKAVSFEGKLYNVTNYDDMTADNYGTNGEIAYYGKALDEDGYEVVALFSVNCDGSVGSLIAINY